jgi:DNA-binding transcriptional ArsR family regulator
MRMPGREQLGAEAAWFAALGHPVRAGIYAAIRIEPVCVCELSVLLGMSSPALMHHLKILGKAGLIEARKVGKFAVYHPLGSLAELALDAAHLPEWTTVGANL